MNILFIHQNLPAQFKHLINMFLKDSKNTVVGFCKEYAPGVNDKNLASVQIKVYKPCRKPTKNIHNYVYTIESSVLNGQATARILFELKNDGFIPDLCLAHIGWGEALYCKDAFPEVPLIAYCEFYYHAQGVDADFDPEYPITLDDHLRIRHKKCRNAPEPRFLQYRGKPHTMAKTTFSNRVSRQNFGYSRWHGHLIDPSRFIRHFHASEW